MHKVLLVDDSSIVHSFVTNVCEGENFELIHAKSVSEATSLIEKENVSLILLDVIMKEQNGFDYCRELKEGPHKDIPVIFLTGRTESKNIVEGFKVGAVDYVSKPFEKEELLARINSQLNILDIRKQLVDSEKMRSIHSMIATYNHELNNPLQIAMMAMKQLKQSMDEDQLQHAQKLTTAFERIQNIVQKINNIEKIETDSYGNQEMIDLNKE